MGEARLLAPFWATVVVFNPDELENAKDYKWKDKHPNIISKQGILIEGVHFIQKPFSKKDLATKVRDALQGASLV